MQLYNGDCLEVMKTIFEIAKSRIESTEVNVEVSTKNKESLELW